VTSSWFFLSTLNILLSIANAPRYVPNTVLHTDLQIPTVKAEITNFSTKYREKPITHPNELIPALLEDEEPRRLKRFKPTEQRESHKHRTPVREHLM